VADNREALGTTSDKLASVSTTLIQSLGDIKQTLHIAPTTLSNFVNIFEPAQAALTGVGAFNNFANPVSFICGAIQAASRMNGEQSAKLCAQYLAPIVKNRQYNFPPIGENLIVGAQARPNEVTYSEDWMRPDYVPPQQVPPQQPPGAALDASAPAQGPPPVTDTAPLPAEAPIATNPTDGLQGLMVPAAAGSR
jgi:phospholipid/cholesterol/gamma-HCH transport system substrate-binding protein